jgi:hypothetical protein
MCSKFRKRYYNLFCSFGLDIRLNQLVTKKMKIFRIYFCSLIFVAVVFIFCLRKGTRQDSYNKRSFKLEVCGCQRYLRFLKPIICSLKAFVLLQAEIVIFKLLIKKFLLFCHSKREKNIFNLRVFINYHLNYILRLTID